MTDELQRFTVGDFIQWVKDNEVPLDSAMAVMGDDRMLWPAKAYTTDVTRLAPPLTSLERLAKVAGAKAYAPQDPSAATCVSLATLGHADGFEEWQLQIEVEGELLVEFPRTLQAALVLVSAAEPGSVVWDPHGDSDCLVTEAALICDESGGSISGRSSAALHVLWTSGSAGCEGVGL